MYIPQTVCDSCQLCCLRAIQLCLFFLFVLFFNVLAGGVVCLICRIFVFNFPPFSSLILFMKLEHLKDCCVFVNNKSGVLFVLVKSLVQPLPQPMSPRRWSVFHGPLLPTPQCERVGPDPVLGVCPSHFNHNSTPPSLSG